MAECDGVLGQDAGENIVYNVTVFVYRMLDIGEDIV